MTPVTPERPDEQDPRPDQATHDIPTGLPDDTADHSVLTWLVTATFVVILNETIMTTAIPRLMIDLKISASAAQWLSTAFMLTMAVVIPTTGWLLQQLTTRAAYLTAMSAFCAGTLLAGLAPSFVVLLVARVVQASGTAVMMPLLMTTLMHVVHERDRGRVMGNVSLAISVAPALGPAVSGVILQSLSWRWIFLLVLPVAVGVTLAGLRGLRNVGEPAVEKLDLLSIALCIVGFGGLVYGLSEIGVPAQRLVGALVLTVGIIGVGFFTWRQKILAVVGTALLDVRVLAIRTFAVSMAAMSIAFMSLMGAVIVLQLYLQEIRGFSPLVAGMVVMPGGIAMGLAGPLVGRWYDRLGPRPLLIPGGMLLVAASTGLALVGDMTPLAVVMIAHMTLSIGLALVFTPLFTLGLGAVPSHMYSHGSSVLGTTQQVAGAMGTAVFVAVLASVGGGAAGVRWAFGVAVVLALVTLGLVSTLRGEKSISDE
ncbi:MFS transporter, DHA2 family, lincomycin resistance protein [Austwickia chelonae]|uniref:Putative major facilitator superfamily transporter n=1 Tax=Austwickia chelonae NBRC 105200 TaxID=1184607 RepID=K6V8H4_9MICO|nr:MDR family MFS transporter [Austwickia chelonae]GAB78493.1 putative major facilitator superfamily transporter [Austwickia chelonae NBRC 105200]SEW40121.1 MFS transporter, DHA2 family, lincomycin resistance protein [Austwickia chelonae]